MLCNAGVPDADPPLFVFVFLPRPAMGGSEVSVLVKLMQVQLNVFIYRPGRLSMQLSWAMCSQRVPHAASRSYGELKVDPVLRFPLVLLGRCRQVICKMGLERRMSRRQVVLD